VHGAHDRGDGGCPVLDLRDEAGERETIAVEHALDEARDARIERDSVGHGR
jgi:hypothetical protein